MFKFNYIDGTTDEFFHKADYPIIKENMAKQGIRLTDIVNHFKVSISVILNMLTGETRIEPYFKKYLIENKIYDFKG